MQEWKPVFLSFLGPKRSTLDMAEFLHKPVKRAPSVLSLAVDDMESVRVTALRRPVRLALVNRRAVNEHNRACKDQDPTWRTR